MKALDDIYKIYTLLHLLTPIWKQWNALLASVIQAKNTAPEKKPTDHSNAVRSAGSREKKVHTALCSATACAYSASASKSCTSSKDDILFCLVFPTNIVRNEHFLEISENDFGKLTKV